MPLIPLLWGLSALGVSFGITGWGIGQAVHDPDDRSSPNLIMIAGVVAAAGAGYLLYRRVK